MRWLCAILLLLVVAPAATRADELDDFVADKVQMNPAEPRIPDEARSKRRALAPAPPPRVVSGAAQEPASALPETETITRSEVPRRTPWPRYLFLAGGALAVAFAVAAFILRRK